MPNASHSYASDRPLDLWHWKLFSCPACTAQPGSSCYRQNFDAPSGWERVAPHAARKHNAAASRENWAQMSSQL
jgi:hypothetical protein